MPQLSEFWFRHFFLDGVGGGGRAEGVGWGVAWVQFKF